MENKAPKLSFLLAFLPMNPKAEPPASTVLSVLLRHVFITHLPLYSSDFFHVCVPCQAYKLLEGRDNNLHICTSHGPGKACQVCRTGHLWFPPLFLMCQALSYLPSNLWERPTNNTEVLHTEGDRDKHSVTVEPEKMGLSQPVRTRGD